MINYKTDTLIIKPNKKIWLNNFNRHTILIMPNEGCKKSGRTDRIKKKIKKK